MAIRYSTRRGESKGASLSIATTRCRSVTKFTRLVRYRCCSSADDGVALARTHTTAHPPAETPPSISDAQSLSSGARPVAPTAALLTCCVGCCYPANTRRTFPEKCALQPNAAFGFLHVAQAGLTSAQHNKFRAKRHALIVHQFAQREQAVLCRIRRKCHVRPTRCGCSAIRQTMGGKVNEWCSTHAATYCRLRRCLTGEDSRTKQQRKARDSASAPGSGRR